MQRCSSMRQILKNCFNPRSSLIRYVNGNWWEFGVSWPVKNKRFLVNLTHKGLIRFFFPFFPFFLRYTRLSICRIEYALSFGFCLDAEEHVLVSPKRVVHRFPWIWLLRKPLTCGLRLSKLAGSFLLSDDFDTKESSGNLQSYDSVLEEIQAIFANHKWDKRRSRRISIEFRNTGTEAQTCQDDTNEAKLKRPAESRSPIIDGSSERKP